MSREPQAVSPQNAHIAWGAEGVPESSAFGDVYFSRDNGLEETRYVFLGQNDLPQRWLDWQQPVFTVAETGFGTGLNFLATWQAFNRFRAEHPEAPLIQLHFVSTEKFPLTQQDLRQALALWPELSELSAQLCRQYPVPVNGCQRLIFGQVTLDLWLMDVQDAMRELPEHPDGWIDAWYLDGFAPSKNPDMWQQSLFDAMARHARAGCTVSTFTAAGFVRRGLISAGFAMRKVPGFGSKREMLVGTLNQTTERTQAAPWFNRARTAISPATQVTIIGGGLAGVTTAWALARRGIGSQLVFQEAELAQGASGNRQGALYPFLNLEHSPHSQIYQAGFQLAEQLITLLEQQGFELRSARCGVLQLALDEKRHKRFSALCDGRFPPSFVQWLDAEQASAQAGIPLPVGGMYFPQGRWVNPGDLCRALLAHGRQFAEITLKPHTTVDNPLELAAQGPVVLATGWQAAQLAELDGLGLDAIRGQVSHVSQDHHSTELKTVLCYDGYLTPAHSGQHCIGASFVPQWQSLAPNAQENQHNLELLRQGLPDWPAFAGQDADTLDARVGVRGISRDHVPLIGAVPNTPAVLKAYRDLAKGKPAAAYPMLPVIDNLYLSAGHGARGICSALLCAETLAAELCQSLPPVSQSMLDALHPARRVIRQLKRGH